MSAISELSTIHRTKAKTPEEKRLAKKEAGRDNKAGYLFLLPWLIGLIVITLRPLLASLYLSFTNYNLIQATAASGFFVRADADHSMLALYQALRSVALPVRLGARSIRIDSPDAALIASSWLEL